MNEIRKVQELAGEGGLVGDECVGVVPDRGGGGEKIAKEYHNSG